MGIGGLRLPAVGRGAFTVVKRQGKSKISEAN